MQLFYLQFALSTQLGIIEEKRCSLSLTRRKFPLENAFGTISYLKLQVICHTSEINLIISINYLDLYRKSKEMVSY